MRTANNFYNWWQNTIKGDYIGNNEFDLVLERFNNNKDKNNDNESII